ncbi:MAG: sensor histidine kinase [Promethearchaeota archaeon]
MSKDSATANLEGEYDEDSFRNNVIRVSSITGLAMLGIILATELAFHEPDWWLTVVAIVVVCVELAFLYSNQGKVARYMFLGIVMFGIFMQGVLYSGTGIDMRWMALALILLSIVADIKITTVFVVVCIVGASIITLPTNPSAFLNTVPVIVLFYVIAFFISNVIFRILRAQKERLEKVRQAQSFLVAKEKLASIGELAAGITHEINNPLMGIINYAELVVDDIDNGNTSIKPGDENYQFLKDILKEASRISEITKNVLSFAKKDEEAPISVLLPYILDRTLSLLSPIFKRDNIKVVARYREKRGDVPPIRGKPRKLQQVFLNILKNAQQSLDAKYGTRDERKLVEVDIQVINGKWGGDGDHVPEIVQVSFLDHGVGLKRELVPKIFEPFFSTRRGTGADADVGEVGVGLGLTTCFHIVYDHGGRLLVDTREGEYFKITAEFPVE